MAWTNRTTLSAIELAIYIACTPVVIYSALKHRRFGKLGHFFLAAFILLRVIGDGLVIHQRDRVGGLTTTAAIINSVGISPLILATMSILNEARAYLVNYDLHKSKKYLSWFMEFQIHMVLVVGIALLAIGLSDASTDTAPNKLKEDHTHAKVGAILILLTWLFITIWNVWSLRYLAASPLHKLGGRLLVATTITLLFIGVRVVYLVVYTFHPSHDLDLYNGPFAVDLVLVFLMQLIAFLILLGGLLWTRDIARAQMIEPMPLTRVEEGKYVPTRDTYQPH